MGYAGGSKENPHYHDLGDHSETVQIDFDPHLVSYKELLEVFWDSHSPEWGSYLRQYMSIIFYHDDEQKNLALESKEERQRVTKGKISTEIVPLSVFYLAESYHQKYYLRGVSGIMRDFRAIYPDDRNFIGSTAAARVNGYIGGYGTLSRLKEEIGGFGLSAAGNKILSEIVSRREDKVATHG